MLVGTTRKLSAWALSALIYGALFLGVVIVHLGVTASLRELGLNSAISLMISGAIVLTIVVFGVHLLEGKREHRADAKERRRNDLRLPSGPCCVLLPRGQVGTREQDMPWQLASPCAPTYPKLAREIGVEGFALLEFEVSAEGKAKNIDCVDVWPSKVFADAARTALSEARFTPKRDAHIRYGTTYRWPFLFRIDTAHLSVASAAPTMAAPPRPAALMAHR